MVEYALYRLFRFMNPEHIAVRRHRLPGLDICDITIDELDAIESVGSNLGLDFQISQFCLTVALSFLASTLSSPPKEDRVYIVFVVVIVVGFALGLIFGIKWSRDREAFSKLIQKVRDRQVGPVGEEGKELKVSELQNLKPSEPQSPERSGV